MSVKYDVAKATVSLLVGLTIMASAAVSPAESASVDGKVYSAPSYALVSGGLPTEPCQGSCSNAYQSLESAVMASTNEERAKRGLKTLQWDDQLADIARSHSEDMAARNYFSHVNPEGQMATDRARESGYDTYKDLGNGYAMNGIGENLVKIPLGNVKGVGVVTNDPRSVANASITLWLGSPSHRANMLNDRYDHIGVGVEFDGRNYLITENFQ